MKKILLMSLASTSLLLGMMTAKAEQIREKTPARWAQMTAQEQENYLDFEQRVKTNQAAMQDTSRSIRELSSSEKKTRMQGLKAERKALMEEYVREQYEE